MKPRESIKNLANDKTSFPSGKDISNKEFMEGIKLAEKGPFYTVQESMKLFDKWVKKREKK